MAFDYFAQQSVDIAIIEVGLGGRLDSTKIIVPELSIITNIGWDHMNLLGNSLELIAAEKAGIIKQNIPIVIGEIIPESKPIFEAKALELNAPIHWASTQRRVNDFEINGHLLQVTIAQNSTNQRHQYQLDLCGHYQTKNLLTVLSAVTILQEQGWKIDDSTIQKALPNSKKINGLHGRWEIIQTHPLLVLDVGHNEDGIKQIVAQLALVAKAQVHIIIGMVKDKEIDTVLKLLPKEARYYFTKAQIPRALDQNILLEKAANYQLIGTSFAEVNEAIQSAKEHATKDDTIIVCGSVFLVGEVPYSSTTN
jgi:dihydrofolate synthase/folylpolyglutamate synthase